MLHVSKLGQHIMNVQPFFFFFASLLSKFTIGGLQRGAPCAASARSSAFGLGLQKFLCKELDVAKNFWKQNSSTIPQKTLTLLWHESFFEITGETLVFKSGAMVRSIVWSYPKSFGLVRDLNPGPLAPKARIIPLDQRATCMCYL